MSDDAPTEAGLSAAHTIVTQIARDAMALANGQGRHWMASDVTAVAPRIIAAALRAARAQQREADVRALRDESDERDEKDQPAYAWAFATVAERLAALPLASAQPAGASAADPVRLWLSKSRRQITHLEIEGLYVASDWGPTYDGDNCDAQGSTPDEACTRALAALGADVPAVGAGGDARLAKLERLLRDGWNVRVYGPNGMFFALHYDDAVGRGEGLAAAIDAAPDEGGTDGE